MKYVLKHPILANHDDNSIIVYQAYNNTIGRAAAQYSTLDVNGYSKTRMTWIKPSFLWMMYRSDWGQKDDNQNCILKIRITRQGFIDLLNASCLSSFDNKLYENREDWQKELETKPNRVQWDPDKDIHLSPMQRRAIQIGISAEYVDAYLKDWIVSIEDITQFSNKIHKLVKSGKINEAEQELIEETEVSTAWLGLE